MIISTINIAEVYEVRGCCNSSIVSVFRKTHVCQSCESANPHWFLFDILKHFETYLQQLNSDVSSNVRQYHKFEFKCTISNTIVQ